jgi:hypothetical protein
MSRDEEDDLYDEEFDFVDDDDEEEFDEASDVEGEVAAEDGTKHERASNNRAPRDQRADRDDRDGEADEGVDDEPVDEYGRTAPKADYVVHIYEYQKFKRTIDRPFTPEDAESFASEYNRTAKSYGRLAVTAKNDAKPKKTLD